MPTREVPVAVTVTQGALPGCTADAIAQSGVVHTFEVPVAKTPGEDAWLDELEEISCHGVRDKLRTWLRAYRANLLTNAAGQAAPAVAQAELSAALEEVLEIGCWQAIPGTEDYKCRWCSMAKYRGDVTHNAPHEEDCAYMAARALLRSKGQGEAMSDASRDKELARELDVESLAAKFHEIYQQEAKRQGDVRHKDDYADLPENIKEFDRVLARYVAKLLAQVRLEEAKWWQGDGNSAFHAHSWDDRDERLAALRRAAEGGGEK